MNEWKNEVMILTYMQIAGPGTLIIFKITCQSDFSAQKKNIESVSLPESHERGIEIQINDQKVWSDYSLQNPFSDGSTEGL